MMGRNNRVIQAGLVNRNRPYAVDVPLIKAFYLVRLTKIGKLLLISGLPGSSGAGVICVFQIFPVFENPEICLRPFTKEIEGYVLKDMPFGDSGSLGCCRSTDTPQQHPRTNICT